MPQNAPTPAAPALLPVLSRGKHRHPASGACFMEYTSLLAGEPFSDHPACVDPSLAAVLRHANDTLGDAQRPALVPLLGRAIGLVAPQRSGGARAVLAGLVGRSRPRTDGPGPTAAQLHAAVTERFRAAVHLPVPARTPRWQPPFGIDELFWDVVGNPPAPQDAEERTAWLVDHLTLLHRCYEEALAELGAPAGGVAPEQRTDRPEVTASPVP